MSEPALIVIDVQKAFDDPSWGPRNNPGCLENILALIAYWREHSRPVVYIRHDSTQPGSPLAPGHPGNALRDELAPDPDLLVTKHVNSAFYGHPDLHAWLGQRRIDAVTICGITTNHCCETTARMAGNLGYATTFVIDATHTFDRRAPDGTVIDADTLARTTAANLDGEFATVLTTGQLLTGARSADAAAPRTITRSAELGADPETVFAVLADATRIPEWAPAFADTVAPLTAGESEVTKDGVRFTLRVRLAAAAGTVDYLREIAPGRTGGAYLRVVPTPGGGSAVTMTVPAGADPAAAAATVQAELFALERLTGGV